MNIPDIPKKTILYLKGIFPDECTKIENVFSNQSDTSNDTFSNSIEQPTTPNLWFENKKKIIYDIIPKHFTSINNWIDLTKNIRIKCWYCELLFTGVPVFIPKYINKTTTGTTFDTHGIFCNFGCAYQYLITSSKFIDDNTQWDKIEMLKIIYYKFYNNDIKEFIPAPNKYELNCYGGPMNIINFKKELKRINNLNMK